MHVYKTASQNTIKASEFKSKCLRLMDEVAKHGKELIITKNGQPVARLVPYQNKPATLFGTDRDKLEILGDVISPLGVTWEADSNEFKDTDS